MKLHSFRIEGFRRHVNTEVLFSDATFLIGENNAGKSSVLKALEYFLNGTKKIPLDDFARTVDKESGAEERIADKIVLTAEFRNCPLEAHGWHGYKGRLLPYYMDQDTDETGLCCIYRKTYYPDKENFEGEMKEYKRELKTGFASCSTLADFIQAGLDESIINELFPNEKLTKKVTKKEIDIFKDHNISDLFDINESENDWFTNPGGFQITF